MAQMISANLSRHEIQQPARSAHEYLAAGRCHRWHAVVDDDQAEFDKAFDEIGFRQATLRWWVAKCAQSFPLVRCKFDVGIAVHVASRDGTVGASVSDAA